MGLRAEMWVVRPDTDQAGVDVVTRGGVVVAKILWLRELRYPAMCRARMSAGLAGAFTSHAHRKSWTADGGGHVWTLLHNGVAIGELLTTAEFGGPICDGVLAGLNMLPGRRPEACEPMPLEPVRERHLRVVR